MLQLKMEIQRISSLYITKPWGGVIQDDFINLVLQAEYTRAPFELLQDCQDIENVCMRDNLLKMVLVL